MAKLLSPDDLDDITSRTLHHYEAHAESYWEGTKDHDVTQNYAAFLDALPKRPGLRLLDLGCGPGRDLVHFRNLGHEPSGLDGSPAFCEMARSCRKGSFSLYLAPDGDYHNIGRAEADRPPNFNFSFIYCNGITGGRSGAAAAGTP